MDRILCSDCDLNFESDSAAGTNQSSGLSIAHGPYITEMTDTSVRITWHTNLVSSGTVEYGVSTDEYTNSVTEVRKSLVTLSTCHTVLLTGLTPGTTYYYKLGGNRYYYLDNEEKRYTRNHCTSAGRPLEIDSSLPAYTNSFTTFDSRKTSYDFYFISDVKADVAALNKLLDKIDHDNCDFVVYGGDQFGALETESQIWNQLIDLSVAKFAAKTPFFYVRGDDDYSGAFARRLKTYIPTVSNTAYLKDMGRYYNGFKHGNASFAVLDTGVMQPDSYSGYQGLFAVQPYSIEQYSWLQEYAASNEWTSSSLKIAFMHNPDFGNTDDGDTTKWKNLLSNAGTQLVLAGHQLKYAHHYPGDNGESYHKIILGRKQMAKVNVTGTGVIVTVYDLAGHIIDRVVISQQLKDYSNYSHNEMTAAIITKAETAAIVQDEQSATTNQTVPTTQTESITQTTPTVRGNVEGADHQPYVHQPYITALTTDSVIISWVTDESKSMTGAIEYGITSGYGCCVKETQDGLVTVGSFHTVKITGLQSGTTYHYRTVNVEVTSLTAGNIMLGETSIGKDRTFTTHSINTVNYSFLYLADTHNKVDPVTGNNIITDLLECPYITDDYSFVVNGGDISTSISNKKTVYNAMIDPFASFSNRKPFYFIHGNHDNRGAEADTIEYTLPTLTGQWYYSFRQGNAAYAVIDCGDGYATWKSNPQRLERTEEYLADVFDWTKNYFKSIEWTSAPLKVVHSHKHSFTAPDIADELTYKYIDLFNSNGVKLVIHGHTHRNNLTPPGDGKEFYQLSVGVFSIARFVITGDSMEITIYRREPETGEWSTVNSFSIPY